MSQTQLSNTPGTQGYVQTIEFQLEEGLKNFRQYARLIDKELLAKVLTLADGDYADNESALAEAMHYYVAP